MLRTRTRPTRLQRPCLVSVALLGATIFHVMAPAAFGQPFGAVLDDSNWPMIHGDIRHTGRSAANGPSTNAVEVKWEARLGPGIRTSPTIWEDDEGNETVYIGAARFPMCALDAETGDVKWCSAEGRASVMISSPVLRTDGTAYIGARDNDLYTVDKDGGTLWRYSIPLDGDIVDSVAIDPIDGIGVDGAVYMSCGCLSNGLFHAMNPDTGLPLWTFKLGGSARGSSPAIGTDGTIYIGSTARNLNALTPTLAEATRKWPAADVGAALNRYTSPAIGDPVLDGPTFLYEPIYIGTKQGLAAFNSETGEMLPGWPFDTVGRINSTPAIAFDGTVYIGDTKRVFYAINPDGTEKFSLTGFDGRFETAPVIGANGIVYVAAGRIVYAIDPATESILWEWRAKRRIRFSSPAIGKDGTLYVGVRNRTLYALQAASPSGALLDDESPF